MPAHSPQPDSSVGLTVMTQLLEAPPDDEERVGGSGLRRLLGVGVGLLLLTSATYVVPGLSRFQPWLPGEDYVPFWNIIGRELLGEGVLVAEERQKLKELQTRSEPTVAPPSAAPAATPAPPPEKLGPVFPSYTPAEKPERPVELENAEALDYFYRKLTLVDLKVPNAMARAAHWGDSIIADDGESFAIRRRLQARFGDGGHGFHALGRYNVGYVHRGVHYRDGENWATRCQILFKCERDGRYGYAGVSVRSSGLGSATWRTTEEPPGDRASRFELWYAGGPASGPFEVIIDGTPQPLVETANETPKDGVAVFTVSDGAHEFRVRGRVAARGYGVVLEREGPGIVWDSLSMIGAFTQRFDYQDPEHIAGQIRQRNLDLLVFQLGGNDVQREHLDLRKSMQPYEDELTRVVTKYRKGKPEASCLILAVTDHGTRVGNTIRSRPIVPKLGETQRKVAFEQGCAFFDLFTAMGGEGSIARWVYAKPALASGDLGHPTSEGHEILGSLIVDALVDGYEDYRSKMAGKPLPELESDGALSDEG